MKKKMVPIQLGAGPVPHPGNGREGLAGWYAVRSGGGRGDLRQRDSKPAPAGRIWTCALAYSCGSGGSAGDPHPMHSAQPGRARVWKAVRPVCPRPCGPTGLQGGPSGYLGGQQAGGCLYTKMGFAYVGRANVLLQGVIPEEQIFLIMQWKQKARGFCKQGCEKWRANLFGFACHFFVHYSRIQTSHKFSHEGLVHKAHTAAAWNTANRSGIPRTTPLQVCRPHDL